MSADSEKPNITGVIGCNHALWQNHPVRVSRFERPRASLALLQLVRSIVRSAYSWLFFRATLTDPDYPFNAGPVKFRRIVVDGLKTTLWGHFSTDFQTKVTDEKVFSSPKRRYFICDNPPWTGAVVFLRSVPTQGKALALAVNPRQRPGVAQRAAIFCCYGYPDRLTLNGRSYEEEDAYRLEKEWASQLFHRPRTVAFCLGEPTTWLPSRFAMYLRRLKSFFTALFTIRRAVDEALYRCVYRGDRTYGCGDIVFSVGDHRQKLVCGYSLGIKGLSGPSFHNTLSSKHSLLETEKIEFWGDLALILPKYVVQNMRQLWQLLW